MIYSFVTRHYNLTIYHSAPTLGLTSLYIRLFLELGMLHVAQKVIHSMRHYKGRTRYMVIKIDLEKTYDRIKWEFVKKTLVDVGIPSILECISFASMSLLWNGGVTNSFNPTRSIHQGDLISSYIFVPCMERLSQLIELAVNHQIWHPVKISRVGPIIPHLCFADDIILLAKASRDQELAIKGILDLLYSRFGQKVNHRKSNIFFVQIDEKS